MIFKLSNAKTYLMSLFDFEITENGSIFSEIFVIENWKYAVIMVIFVRDCRLLRMEEEKKTRIK